MPEERNSKNLQLLEETIPIWKHAAEHGEKPLWAYEKYGYSGCPFCKEYNTPFFPPVCRNKNGYKCPLLINRSCSDRLCGRWLHHKTPANAELVLNKLYYIQRHLRKAISEKDTERRKLEHRRQGQFRYVRSPNAACEHIGYPEYDRRKNTGRRGTDYNGGNEGGTY